MAVDPLFQIIHTNWDWKPLAEVCGRGGGDIQTGPFGSQLHASDYVTAGIPVIMPQNISKDRVDADGIARITRGDADRLSRYLVKKGDIVYSRRGDVKRKALITAREDGWLCGTGCLRIRFGKGTVDPVYASYFLSHPAAGEWVVRHAVGATMPNLNTSILGALPFLLPPPEEQHAIASVLGALDDKIEQNRRTVGVLEKLARAIFRAWFVDFEPVKARAAGATRFPSMPQAVFDALPATFVDSDIDPVPEGWDVGNVRDLAALSKLQVKPQECPDETFEHFSIPAFDAGKRAITEIGEAIKSNKFLVIDNCVLLSKLNPRIPRAWLPPTTRGKRRIASTEFLVFVPHVASDRHYLYCQFQQVNFQHSLAQAASGTSNSHQRVRPKNVLARQVITPSPLLRKSFTDIVDPMFATIEALRVESEKLAQMRDYLLPKLLSGEVRVEIASEHTPAMP